MFSLISDSGLVVSLHHAGGVVYQCAPTHPENLSHFLVCNREGRFSLMPSTASLDELLGGTLPVALLCQDWLLGIHPDPVEALDHFRSVLEPDSRVVVLHLIGHAEDSQEITPEELQRIREALATDQMRSLMAAAFDMLSSMYRVRQALTSVQLRPFLNCPAVINVLESIARIITPKNLQQTFLETPVLN